MIRGDNKLLSDEFGTFLTSLAVKFLPVGAKSLRNLSFSDKITVTLGTFILVPVRYTEDRSMIKIFTCDDDAAFSGLLTEKIRDTFVSLGAEIDVTPFTSSVDCLRAVRAEKDSPDVVFLDIDMPSVSGFDVAAEINKARRGAVIVFVSGKQELVFESLDYHPFSFIRKNPAESLSADLSKVCRSIMRDFMQDTLVEIRDVYSGAAAVTAEEILFIGSEDHYLIYTLRDKKTLKERGNIKAAEDRFRNFGFIRPHSRYLVNMAHITFFNPSIGRIVLDSRDSVPVSRALKSAAHEEYLKYKRVF